MAGFKRKGISEGSSSSNSKKFKADSDTRRSAFPSSKPKYQKPKPEKRVSSSSKSLDGAEEFKRFPERQASRKELSVASEKGGVPEKNKTLYGLGFPKRCVEP